MYTTYHTHHTQTPYVAYSHTPHTHTHAPYIPSTHTHYNTHYMYHLLTHTPHSPTTHTHTTHTPPYTQHMAHTPYTYSHSIPLTHHAHTRSSHHSRGTLLLECGLPPLCHSEEVALELEFGGWGQKLVPSFPGKSPSAFRPCFRGMMRSASASA